LKIGAGSEAAMRQPDPLAKAEAQGFSNVALIKYMGKLDATSNLACNPSLSYTLPHLRTTVVVRRSPDATDRWRHLRRTGNDRVRLTPHGRRRLLDYVRRLCHQWQYPQHLLVESTNNFPADAGIASSASSFSAVTKAVAALLNRCESNEELARQRRTASGSSCRSFFGPRCACDGETIQAMDFPTGRLLHMVIIVDDGRKSVASSEAHARVVASLNFAGRPERARARMERLLRSLGNSDWAAAYAISWEEFIDMHSLFETSNPPFSYRTAESDRILVECRAVWDTHGDGPIVTMDAGPNVHLLFRRDQEKMFLQMRERFSTTCRVLSADPTEA
jgi:diphosphomevalonate decarboxylase